MTSAQDEPTTAELEHIIDSIKDYVKTVRAHGPPSEHNFHPTDTDDTKRVYARVTDDLKAFTKRKTDEQFFKSREMVVGMALAFAATHEDRFDKFTLEQAYSSAMQDMDLGEHSMNSPGSNSEHSVDTDTDTPQNAPEESQTRTSGNPGFDSRGAPDAHDDGWPDEFDEH